MYLFAFNRIMMGEEDSDISAVVVTSESFFDQNGRLDDSYDSWLYEFMRKNIGADEMEAVFDVNMSEESARKVMIDSGRFKETEAFTKYIGGLDL